MRVATKGILSKIEDNNADSATLGSVIGIAAMVQQKKGGQTRIPYGPFLAIAAAVFLFLQEPIMALWQMYLGLSGLQ